MEKAEIDDQEGGSAPTTALSTLSTSHTSKNPSCNIQICSYFFQCDLSSGTFNGAA